MEFPILDLTCKLETQACKYFLNVSQTDKGYKIYLTHISPVRAKIYFLSAPIFVKYSNCKKCLGVNKLALVAQTELVDGVKENHDSLSQLVHECGIHDISHDTMTWTGDQKVLNDACGIGNHKSTYPCGHCMAKFPLKGDEKAELRTLGDLDDEHGNFVRDGGKLKNAKKYKSVINKRFIHGPREKKVFPLPCPPLQAEGH